MLPHRAASSRTFVSVRSASDRRLLAAAVLAAALPAAATLAAVAARPAPAVHRPPATDAAPFVELAVARLAAAPSIDDDAAARALRGLALVRGLEVLTADGAVVARAARAGAEPPRCAPEIRTAALRGTWRAVVTVEGACAGASVEVAAAPRVRTSEALVALAASIVAALGAVAALRRRPRRAGDAALITASERVARGDLAVRLPADPTPDGAAVAASFNEMVAELALTRERVAYLQRIAGWQELARRLAHEIKNPLTPIQLAVQEAARRYEGDDAKFRRTLDTAREVVEEEVATLRRLVGAFSEFARLPDVKPAPADLAEFVRDMAGSRELLGDLDPGVTVHFEPGAEAVAVRLDGIMFRRAVENLVRNAVEALGARGGNVWVRVQARPGGGPDSADPPQAWIIVEDDGPGVPEAQRARIFDPYFTTKATGTGLGLAIVRKIALDHDGDVGIEERPGGGARFVLTLPWRRDARAPRRSFVTFSRAASGGDAST